MSIAAKTREDTDEGAQVPQWKLREPVCQNIWKRQYTSQEKRVNHSADFNVAAEWTFFATIHGKSPCGGIGGTIKHTVIGKSAMTL